MIIHASMRTDIPAFYYEWFTNRIREGYVRVRNPYQNIALILKSLICLYSVQKIQALC